MTVKTPFEIKLRVNTVFESKTIEFQIHSGLTTFVGTNASGKTQTLKALRDYFKGHFDPSSVRYLSSNRIGAMEIYRSQTSDYGHRSEDNYSPGGESAKANRYIDETATGDLFVLDVRKDVRIKVSERLSEFFNRNIFLRWDSGNLKVFLEHQESGKEYSVAAEASGLINLISILTALYDDNIHFLLIDEPEVSLHPQLQAYLLREIKLVTNKTNKIVVISTHSAEMVDLHAVDDLTNFIFFSEGQLPKQIPRDAPELQNKKLQEFLLHMNLTFKEGFFAKKVFLIEGITDFFLCRYLANRLDLNTDIAGTQIIPVQGKTQFSVITKLFRLVGKEICLLTDLDGFADNNDVINLFATLPESNAIANSFGSKNLQCLITTIKSDIHELIERNKETLAALCNEHSYWLNHEKENSANYVVTRAVLAVLLSSDENEMMRWPDLEDWRSIKLRLLTLLKALERLGCFILRKGSIENYYFNGEVSTPRKVTSSLDEMSLMDSYTDEQIRHQYEDIIRALNYAAASKKINESSVVKKELLCEIALVLNELKTAKTKTELMHSIKQMTGKKTSLFDYELIKDEDRKGVEVSLRSQILQVKGFPFKIYDGDNVNSVVDRVISPK